MAPSDRVPPDAAPPGRSSTAPDATRPVDVLTVVAVEQVTPSVRRVLLSGTPEATAAVLDRQLPGVAEAIRAHGVAKGVPTAALSRGLAGVAGGTLVVNLPGSRGGVADAIELLAGIVPHAVSQIRGVDH